jgi:hypothetical protein
MGTASAVPVPFGKSTDIFSKVGTFLGHHRTIANGPQFTTNPPQLHHKKPTRKTHVFPNPLKNGRKSTKKSQPKPGLFSPKNLKVI